MSKRLITEKVPSLFLSGQRIELLCLWPQSGLLFVLLSSGKLLSRSTSGHLHDLLPPEGTATVLTRAPQRSSSCTVRTKQCI